MQSVELKKGRTAVLLTTQFGAAEASEHSSEPADAPAYGFEAAYTADLWRNARGGRRTGGTYLDNLDLTLSIDGERAWGHELGQTGENGPSIFPVTSLGMRIAMVIKPQSN